MLSIARSTLAALTLVALGATPTIGAAQDNYEIQVYGSETVPRSVTMFENMASS